MEVRMDTEVLCIVLTALVIHMDIAIPECMAWMVIQVLDQEMMQNEG